MQFIYRLVVFFLAATACTAHSATSSEIPDYGLKGRVNLNGVIFSSACDIATGDHWQAVGLGTETRSHMKRFGEGEPQPFTIQLTGCTLDGGGNGTPWQYLTVTFDGADNKGMFRVSGAGGVALQLTDENGQIVTPGKAIPYREVAVGDIKLNYQVRLKASAGNLVMGSYQTTLRYKVEYF